MKRFFAWMLIITLMLGISPAQAAFVLPAGLSRIEDQAFEGDESIEGVVTLPEGVVSVGDDAFSQTGLYALVLPENTVSVGRQALPQAAYVYAHGAQTTLDDLSGVKLIIAPQGSAAQAYAEANGLDFAQTGAVVSDNTFYYRPVDGGCELLCAIDAGAAGSTVTIPAQAGGMDVVALSAYAFVGMGHAEQIRLPEALEELVDDSLLSYCPNASVQYYGGTLRVSGVTATVEKGAMGESITWEVETVSESGIASYDYTLYKDGQSILTTRSLSASFVYTADVAGSYQLVVDVTDAAGATTRGTSSALFIAVESMLMNVPATLANGSNLEIEIIEVAGAANYSLFVTNEETGEIVSYRTVSSAGTITFDGYLFDAGVYRISGYVYGNDFRYSVPTVKLVTVSGEKAAAPVLPEYEPIVYQQYHSYELELPSGEYQVRYWYRYPDGTESTKWIESNEDYFWLYFGGSTEVKQLSSGGTVLMQACQKQENAWTAWSEVREMTVLSAETITLPELNAPTEHAAGTDCTISFSSAEHVEEYRLIVCKEYIANDRYWESTDHIYSKWFSSGKTVVIPGYELSAGTYYVLLDVEAEEGYEAPTLPVVVEMTVSGTRPSAPIVTVDKTEAYISNDRIALSVHSTGAEGGVIKRKVSRTNGDTSSGENSFSLDENGNGSLYINTYYGEQYIDAIMHLYAYSIVDGIWSEPAVVQVQLKDREPLGQTTITAPETLQAGRDLTFSFAPVENADSYRVYLYRSYSDSSLYNWSSSYSLPNQPLTLDGYQLTQGNYRIVVEAQSDEFGESTTECTFKVTGTRPAAPAVTVDKTEVLVQEYYTFEIDTQGAEELRYQYEWQDGGYVSGRINILEPPTKWSTYEYFAKVLSYSFTVLRDGVWSAWSPAINITIANAISLDPPTFTMPSALALGEDLTVSINSVEGATQYEAELFNSRGTEITSQTLYTAAGGTVTFDGYRMNAGTYTVRVTARGTSSTSTAQSSVVVSSGDRPAAPVSAADTEIGRINVSYKFTIPTDGAEQAAVRYYKEGSPNNVNYRTFAATGSSTRWSDSHSYAGDVWLYAFAVKQNGRWSPWGATHRVTITDREQLGKVTITLPETVEAGQDVLVSFTGVEHADSYKLRLSHPNGSSNSWTSYPDTQRCLYGYDLEPGTYRIAVEASGAEYTNSITEKTFTVTGQRTASPEVTVDRTTGFTDEDFTFVILTNGGEEIAYKYFYSSSSSSSGTLKVLSDPVVWETSFYGEGLISCSFTTLRSGKWSAWSEPIQLTLSKRPVLPEPVITLPTSVALGSDLTVPVDAVEGATSYYLYAYNNRNESIYSRGFSQPGEISVPGYRMSSGAVRVEVSVYGANNASSSASRSTVVLASGQQDAPVVTPPAQTTVSPQSTFTFRVGTEEADRAVVRYYRVGDPNYISYSEFSVLGSSTPWQNSLSSSGNTYAYAFAVRVNGKWSQWSPVTQITVASVQLLPEPEAVIPASLEQGRDLEVQFCEVEGASYYIARTYDSQGNQLDSASSSNPGTVVIEGYLLPVGTIRVQVEAQNSNTSSSINRFVEIQPGTLPAAPLVTPPEDLSVSNSSSCIFTIDTAGAEKAAVRYQYAHSSYGPNYSTFSVSGDTTNWRSYNYSSGSIVAYSFAVKVDGIWSEWSSYTEISYE